MARFESEYGGFSDGERKLLKHQMEESYKNFVGLVAEGRAMSKAAVKKVAQGRVWLGGQALDNGLIDGIGGLLDAIAEAKKRADIDPDTLAQFAIFPRRRKLLSKRALAFPFGGSAYGQLQNIAPILGGANMIAGGIAGLPGVPRHFANDVVQLLQLADLAQTESMLAIMGYGLDIR